MSSDDVEAMKSSIRERALDIDHAEMVAERMRGLADTGLAGESLEQFLSEAMTGTDKVKDWEVGEAIAEVVLGSDYAVAFPWNTRRDERNPESSLPGADLVGLCVLDPDTCRIVFGEVKSSNDDSSPPNVLYGRKGMIDQLSRLAEDAPIRWTLIKWLEARVGSDSPYAESFDLALRTFVNSHGNDVRLVGVLVRDTDPNEADLRARGQALATKVAEPGTAELLAVHMPLEMAAWPDVVAA